MNDWRSEPPDEAGWWEHRIVFIDIATVVKWYIALRRGKWRRRFQGNWHPLPVGGQWRRAPE